MSNKNYYQILGITPSATVAEVETAVEGHYNKWRRLVTHHDPNVVTRANQALQAIERIRTTLTTPDKRAVYDAGKDALIVTYCGGPQCPLSHKLAHRLEGSGYTNVIEYREGIKGWTAAGHKTEAAASHSHAK